MKNTYSHQFIRRACILHIQNSTEFFAQDSWYDKYKGTVNLVQVVDGVLKLNDQVTSLRTKKSYVVKSMGILTPFETPVKALYPGQV